MLLDEEQLNSAPSFSLKIRLNRTAWPSMTVWAWWHKGLLLAEFNIFCGSTCIQMSFFSQEGCVMHGVCVALKAEKWGI